MKTFTEHKLTNDQLRCLSSIVKGKDHKYGMPLLALKNKGLVEQPLACDSFYYAATNKGIDALNQARTEGW